MKRLLTLLALPLLASCAGPEEPEVAEKQWPTYCVRQAIFLDGDDPGGRVLLDMPGWPYGATDKMIEISRHVYNENPWDACKSDDPRSSLRPSGIDWADGRVTGPDDY